MLYKNARTKICSSDRDTDFFDIVIEVLQRDTLSLYLLIISLDYLLQMLLDVIKENGFMLKKARSR